MSLILAMLLQAATALPPPARPVPPAAAARPAGSLFIAPSGEPFRVEPGEAYPTPSWFARADADGDGKLTRGEFRRDFATFFGALDLNGDRVVDGREIVRYEEELVPEVRVGFGSGPEFRSLATAGSGAPIGGGGSEATPGDQRRANARLESLPRGGGRYGLINAPQPVVSADADLNRRITPAEYAAAADRRFTLLDPQERGFLTLATLPKTPIQRRGEPKVKKPR